jgi:NAD(P)-dependent dehydrogenase (short-subunit alcohol dehydrogenase family)
VSPDLGPADRRPGRLDDRFAVITGSTSGIGKGIALHFASLGARVVVHGSNAERARGAVGEIAAAGGRAEAFTGDLTDPGVCRGVIAFAVERLGSVDILVNNAGNFTRGDVETTPLELWDLIMAINLRAPFLCLQEAIRHMKPRRRGSVVNIGSVNAYIGEPKLHAYSVSKGGLMTLTKNAAASLNQFGIRVNQINVGWTLTEGEHRVKLLEGKGERWLDDAVRTRPFGRLLTPQDIAYAAAYFASDESACVTGSVLDLEQYPVGAPPNW